MKNEEKSGRRVVFRRVNGRIVPISVGAAGAGGLLVAGDAARTTQIVTKHTEKAGVTLIKKKFAVQPMIFDRLGTSLTAKRQGKTVATASFYNSDGAKEFAFSWLGVKKAHRGSGLSKLMSREAAGEIRRQGGTTLFNHVIHEGSLKTNLTKRDRLFKLTDAPTKKFTLAQMVQRKWQGKSLDVGGGYYSQKVGLKSAVKNIQWHRARWDKADTAVKKVLYKAFPFQRVTTHSNIFRQTSLKGVPYRKAVEFMPTKSKVALGVGLGIAGASAAYFALRGSNGTR